MVSSFVAQVRSIRFYDFRVSEACQRESVIVCWRPDNVHDVNCLDVMLLWGGYLLGHLEASMAACLSLMMRFLHVVTSENERKSRFEKNTPHRAYGLILNN